MVFTRDLGAGVAGPAASRASAPARAGLRGARLCAGGQPELPRLLGTSAPPLAAQARDGWRGREARVWRRRGRLRDADERASRRSSSRGSGRATTRPSCPTGRACRVSGAFDAAARPAPPHGRLRGTPVSVERRGRPDRGLRQCGRTSAGSSSAASPASVTSSGLAGPGARAWRGRPRGVHRLAAAAGRRGLGNRRGVTSLALPNVRSTISERYTSPLKLFEYLAAGRPIVASDLPAIREVLTDDVNAAARRARAAPIVLADAHRRRVLDDRALARRLSRAAFETRPATAGTRAPNGSRRSSRPPGPPHDLRDASLALGRCPTAAGRWPTPARRSCATSCGHRAAQGPGLSRPAAHGDVHRADEVPRRGAARRRAPRDRVAPAAAGRRPPMDAAALPAPGRRAT